MEKTLIIAEKPSVAKDIGKVLGCTKIGDGYLFSDEYIVSWAVGHLVSLFDPEDYDQIYKYWKINTLPIIPSEIKLKPIASSKKQLNILKKLLAEKYVTNIICATDSGREGELIFRYIYNICKCEKPFKRLWISSLTDSSIEEGFKNLKNGSEYDNLFFSAKCRSESDWLVGINATRAYTIKYNTLLSIGRVQTPTLAIIVEKQKEIDVFVPKDYWKIKGIFENYNGSWFDEKSKDTKIFEKQKATEIEEKVKGKTGVIESVETEEKKQLPSLLYDLTELQRDCNKKFGFSAQQTLNIAQDLYEKRKMITYPRTDSRYLSDDLIEKLPIVLNRLAESSYKEQAEYVLGLTELPVSKRIIDNGKVTDHHAIIPTEVKINTNSLSGQELYVYDLIARRFLSVFYPYYIYNVTKIITDVENEKFVTKGTIITQLGWLELYKNDKKEQKEKDEQENEILPNVSKGESSILEETTLLQKKTQPPNPYTEGALLSAMENAGRFVDDDELKEQLKDSGLGTPATRASIIERLLQVGYISRKGKVLVPTEKGKKLIEVLPTELKSPETTGKWEKGLMSISKGKMEHSKFMLSINRYVDFIIQSSMKSPVDVTFPEEKRVENKNGSNKLALGSCPKCENGQILENSKSYYCTNWKSGCKFIIWKNSLENYGINIDNKFVKTLIKDKKIENITITSPKTKEKISADAVLKDNLVGEIEIINKVLS